MTGATGLQKAAHCGEINHDLRQKFLSLYPYRINYIYKASGDPNWKVSRFRLATGLIDAAISTDCDTFYGTFWDVQTRFAVLDIDKDSKYHDAQELQRLRENLDSVGLSGNVLFQSSNSNGWHLYIPFFDPAPSKEVEQVLKAWLKRLGYDIRGGQLEIFPSGNGLRLPLQRGFAWLDDKGRVLVKREDLELDAALSRFLFDVTNNCNDWSLAKTEIESQMLMLPASAGGDALARRERLEVGGFEQLFSGGKVAEYWEKGRKFWQEGLSSAGQRHDAVLFIGHYLWYGDSESGIAALPGARNDEYRAKLIEDWLTEKHNGFCRHIDEQKWETIRAQIKRAVLWRRDKQPREYEPYRLTDRLLKRLLAIYRKTGKVWTVEDFKQANEDRRDEARCKIRAAVDQCLNEGRQISRSTVCSMTGCSPNTLKKHADLWKLFAIGSGEYNRGGRRGVFVLGSDCAEEKYGQEFLSPSCSTDAGDQGLDAGSCSEELDPIALPPPVLLPGNKPTSEPPASRPSHADSFGSLDAGSLVRWYSGRMADGAGGFGPSYDEFGGDSEIIIDRRGNGGVRRIISLANLVTLIAPSINRLRLLLHLDVICPGVCLQPVSASFRSFCYRKRQNNCVDSACKRLQIERLRIGRCHDVRGPPITIRA